MKMESDQAEVFLFSTKMGLTMKEHGKMIACGAMAD